MILDVLATTGNYTIDIIATIPATDTRDSVSINESVQIAHDATAAEVQSSLSTVLDPNNDNEGLPHTNNIDVFASGDAYILIPQGQFREGNLAITSSDNKSRIATRKDGIHYREIETLQLWLSETDDTLTIESTHTGSTNIDSNEGDDIINVKTTSGQLNINTDQGEDKAVSYTHLTLPTKRIV